MLCAVCCVLCAVCARARPPRSHPARGEPSRRQRAAPRAGAAPTAQNWHVPRPGLHARTVGGACAHAQWWRRGGAADSFISGQWAWWCHAW
eukprot:6995692-Prymnesium_polylepis.1